MPKRVVSEVQASTSQVTSGSDLPREKVELAFKLLKISSRICRVLKYRSSSVLIFLLLQEALGRESGQAQDNTELNALKERVKRSRPGRQLSRESLRSSPSPRKVSL